MSINWNPLYLDTYIPEIPVLVNDGFTAVQTYNDLFYDGTLGVIIAPIQTLGNVSGSQAEFVTGVFDNLIIKRQFTNLYENSTTIDSDFYVAYSSADSSTRDASTGGALIENADFQYIDLSQPYHKISNDSSIAFSNNQLGQEVQLIWDASIVAGGPFTILVDPSTGDGDVQILTVDVADSSTTWIKLIGVDYDASWGMAYIVKQYAGSYTISNY
jgi:hypothetical protein